MSRPHENMHVIVSLCVSENKVVSSSRMVVSLALDSKDMSQKCDVGLCAATRAVSGHQASTMNCSKCPLNNMLCQPRLLDIHNTTPPSIDASMSTTHSHNCAAVSALSLAGSFSVHVAT